MDKSDWVLYWQGSEPEDEDVRTGEGVWVFDLKIEVVQRGWVAGLMKEVDWVVKKATEMEEIDHNPSMEVTNN